MKGTRRCRSTRAPRSRRASRAKHVEAQAIELPHAFRALAEAVDAGDDIWVVVRPDPLGAAEVGDPALRADAGARQQDARLIRAHQFCKHGGLVHGFSFSTEVRVRFAETDAQGIAHN